MLPGIENITAAQMVLFDGEDDNDVMILSALNAMNGHQATDFMSQNTFNEVQQRLDVFGGNPSEFMLQDKIGSPGVMNNTLGRNLTPVEIKEEQEFIPRDKESKKISKESKKQTKKTSHITIPNATIKRTIGSSNFNEKSEQSEFESSVQEGEDIVIRDADDEAEFQSQSQRNFTKGSTKKRSGKVSNQARDQVDQVIFI